MLSVQYLRVVNRAVLVTTNPLFIKVRLLSLVFGIVAGFLAGIIMKGRVFELVGDLIIGVTGAFIRVWLSGLRGPRLQAIAG
jgi:hypothetical protein